MIREMIYVLRRSYLMGGNELMGLLGRLRVRSWCQVSADSKTRLYVSSGCKKVPVRISKEVLGTYRYYFVHLPGLIPVSFTRLASIWILPVGVGWFCCRLPPPCLHLELLRDHQVASAPLRGFIPSPSKALGSF